MLSNKAGLADKELTSWMNIVTKATGQVSTIAIPTLYWKPARANQVFENLLREHNDKVTFYMTVCFDDYLCL